MSTMLDDKTAKRIAELQRVCAELYQVLGSLAEYAGVFDHPDVDRALDHAARGRLVHRDLLPWPKKPLPTLHCESEKIDTKAPTTEGLDALSIKQFCQRHGISDSFFYKLQREGTGPRTMKIAGRKLISQEAAADWRRARGAE